MKEQEKLNYINKLEGFDDVELEAETVSMIYMSARYNNKTIWDVMVDCCYVECKKRKPNIYKKAFDTVRSEFL